MDIEDLKKELISINASIDLAQYADWSADEADNIHRLKTRRREIEAILYPADVVFEEKPFVVPLDCTLEYALQHIRAHYGVRKGQMCTVCGGVRG